MAKLILTEDERKARNRDKKRRYREKHPKIYESFPCSVCNLDKTISTAGYAKNCSANNGSYICKSCLCAESGKTLKPALHVKHDENGNKQCTECGEFMPLDNFTKWTECSDGHRAICKVCRRKTRID